MFSFFRVCVCVCVCVCVYFLYLFYSYNEYIIFSLSLEEVVVEQPSQKAEHPLL